ncbi:MAG: alpha/beta hydrolase [Dongiaceae bacterium]
MNAHATHTYVLIHGGWHGGWVWRDVAAGLRAAGHDVTTPTLTGLGERRHIAQNADLETHIEDVLAHIEMEGLTNVTLVGWSYGGSVITGVLARIPEKIKAMIYLDAFVPTDGKALADYVTPELLAAWEPHKAADKPLLPLPVDMLGLEDPAHVNLVTARLVHQPWRTFYQPVKALKHWPDIPIAYIRCTGFEPSPFAYFEDVMKKDPKVRTDVIETGHSCMLTEPDETIRLLDKYG